jgi:hypothetical protein
MSATLKERVRHPLTTVHELFEELPIEENGHSVQNWNKIKCWAAKNAYTLIFLSVMFVITWAIQIILAVVS